MNNSAWLRKKKLSKLAKEKEVLAFKGKRVIKKSQTRKVEKEVNWSNLIKLLDKVYDEMDQEAYDIEEFMIVL